MHLRVWHFVLALMISAVGAAALTYWSIRPSYAPAITQQRVSIGKGGLPICRETDTEKISVPTWSETLDTTGNLPTLPPQKDGQIVYIELYADNDQASCASADENKLYSFSHPNNPIKEMDGGLAVNLRGHVQFANGNCNFVGFYMNQNVIGMHQGWVETYFRPMDQFEIIKSNRFCVAR